MQSENCIRPFEGNCEADVAPSDNEFDAPDLKHKVNQIINNF